MRYVPITYHIYLNSKYMKMDIGLHVINRLKNYRTVFNENYINSFLETWSVFIAYFPTPMDSSHHRYRFILIFTFLVTTCIFSYSCRSKIFFQILQCIKIKLWMSSLRAIHKYLKFLWAECSGKGWKGPRKMMVFYSTRLNFK